MKKLYCLNFYSQPNGDYREGFHIGLFWTYDEAKRIAVRYKKEVPGFKDYDCDEEITEVSIIGDEEQVSCVYRYTGWNENENFDEVDIIESDCYVDHSKAEEDYHCAQSALDRKEWALNRHVIGQCDWQEGFVRCSD